MFCQETMGGSVLYSHPCPSFSALTTPIFRTPFIPIREIAVGCRPLVSSIRAVDGRPPQPLDGRSSSNKEEILALFKRIQSSISKGEITNSKKRNSKVTEGTNNNKKNLTESISEVLNRSRARGKEKSLSKKGDEILAPKEEEITETRMGLKSARPPSSFKRRSPIPSPRDKNEPEKEILLEREDKNSKQAEKFEEMKLSQLKEVAKSNGIKGYSKLKKNELVELLIRSLGNTIS